MMPAFVEILEKIIKAYVPVCNLWISSFKLVKLLKNKLLRN